VQVRNRCRNQGCIPSKKVVNNRIQNSLGCC
jgi:pyruvate/2-oxoglutarate dehydrogenase complex dihydrolipoamide dehydrogenase (E3) component